MIDQGCTGVVLPEADQSPGAPESIPGSSPGRPAHPNHYGAILADPPWRLRDQGTRISPAYSGRQRKAGAHYQTMPLADILAMGEWVRRVARRNSFLFLWAPNALVLDGTAERTIQAWGFQSKQLIPWVKITKAGRPHIGAGHYTRGCTEMLILARRGEARVRDHGVAGLIQAPRGRHSAKPADQYSLIERLTRGPYLELFARSARDGWDRWGDQAP